METIAYNFHDEKRVLDDKYLKAGDDAKNVKWLEITSDLKLFASHKDFIKKVVDMHDASWNDNDTNDSSSSSCSSTSSCIGTSTVNNASKKNSILNSRANLANENSFNETSSSNGNENSSRVCVRT